MKLSCQNNLIINPDYAKCERIPIKTMFIVLFIVVVLAGVVFLLKIVSNDSNDATSNIDEEETGPLSIVKAEVVEGNMVEVTFSGKLASFEVNDLRFVTTKNGWYSLTADLSKFLTVSGSETRVNEKTQTVAIIDLKLEKNAGTI